MKLFYRKFGEGQAFIILHGLFGASDNWVTIGRELSAQFEIWLPDLRNHGRSPHSTEHDYNSMANDLLEFIVDHNIQKPIILGHSMGGKLAMNFAVQHPDRICQLIVIDIAPKSYLSFQNQSNTLNQRSILEIMMNFDFSGIKQRDQLDVNLSKSIKNDQIRQFLLKNVKRDAENSFNWIINVSTLYKNFNNILEGFVLSSGSLDELISGFPVLFIKGANSEYITNDDEEIIKRIFPYSEIISIPGAGHWVHVDQPDLLIKSIKQFLNLA
jgi:esterase